MEGASQSEDLPPTNNGVRTVDSNACTTTTDENGFVLVQSDSTLTGSTEDSQPKDKAGNDIPTVEESEVNPSPVVGSPAVSQGVSEIEAEDTAPVQISIRPRVESTSSRKDHDTSKHEKKERFSLFKSNNKTGDKPKASKKSGRKDKSKRGRGKADEKSIDDNQSETSYQPDIDLSTKPQVSRKAICECLICTFAVRRFIVHDCTCHFYKYVENNNYLI